MAHDGPPPLTRLWHGALLLFGIVVVLWWALQLLAQIWGWLLLIAVLVGAAGALIRWRNSRRDRW